MGTNNLKFILLAFVAVTLFSFDIPKGWYQAGTPADKDKYEMGTEAGGVDGGNVAYIKSLKKKIDGFGTLMQNCAPGQYLGKRIMMTGYLKSEDVKANAGLWLRVDGKDSLGKYKMLSFDNMYDRPVVGSTKWKKYEIVLDVPSNATGLAYGTLLRGAGQVWIDKISFEIVDNTVPVTGKRKPTNLSFEGDH